CAWCRGARSSRAGCAATRSSRTCARIECGVASAGGACSASPPAVEQQGNGLLDADVAGGLAFRLRDPLHVLALVGEAELPEEVGGGGRALECREQVRGRLDRARLCVLAHHDG